MTGEEFTSARGRGGVCGREGGGGSFLSKHARAHSLKSDEAHLDDVKLFCGTFRRNTAVVCYLQTEEEVEVEVMGQ